MMWYMNSAGYILLETQDFYFLMYDDHSKLIYKSPTQDFMRYYNKINIMNYQHNYLIRSVFNLKEIVR